MIYGGEGNDIFGNPSAAFNGAADDPGNDTFYGEAGSDQFFWEPGDGDDIVEGGAGDSDQIFFSGNAGAEQFFVFADALARHGLTFSGFRQRSISMRPTWKKSISYRKVARTPSPWVVATQGLEAF